MMYHQTKSGYKRISSSEDFVETIIFQLYEPCEPTVVKRIISSEAILKIYFHYRQALIVTLTLKVATQFIHLTLYPMMIHIKPS